MPTYYAELTGGTIKARETFSGGTIYSTGGATVIQNIKSAAATPSSTSQHISITPDVGYDAMGEVQLTVDAIPPEYIIPTGTKTITTNGTHDVKAYQNAYVNVQGGGGATLQTKSVSYTPTASAQTDTVTPDAGYDGLSSVDVTVGAMPTASAPYLSYAEIENDGSIYVDMEIDQSGYIAQDTYSLTKANAVTMRTSSDMTTSGATVTAPSGYYSASASKTIPNASSPRLTDVDIESNGTATATVEVDDGGYIQGQTFSLSLANAVTVQAAQTITPGTTNQTIPAYRWTTGAQTILGDADLVAENIKKDVTIFGVTGTYEGSGGGQKVLINESVITQETASVVVDNITYDSLLITTTGLKTAKTSSMGLFLKVTGSICGNKTCTMYSGNVFASIGNHSGWCKIEDLGNGYKLAMRTDAPVLPENTMNIRYLGVGNNSTPSPYQFGDITKIEIIPSESTYPFTAGTISVYGW